VPPVTDHVGVLILNNLVPSEFHNNQRWINDKIYVLRAGS